ncbi:uncharacterized protein LOC141690623 [Apium graveolens]|uniref:uncharacterized protein LOC141690623 n=1 Tax=Apium graveolens TaxID=4045 RepID=UPI003D79F0DF
MDQVKKGNLDKYLVRDNNNRGDGQKRGNNIVNVVIEGSHSTPRSSDFGEEVLTIQSLPDLVIFFSSKDYEGVNPHHIATLVVTLDIFDNEVRRMLIDNGSSVNILFKHTVDRMQLGSVRNNDCRENPLYGFYVINTPSSYNGIIGRSALTMMQAITSISHLKIKFPTPTEVGEIKGDYGVAETCYNQVLVMAETHQDNKRKAAVLRKQHNIKKHRPRPWEETTKEVQFIESSLDPETIPSSKELTSNQVMVVDNANAVLDQTSPTMQATKKNESEQISSYLKKNSEARVHQMVLTKDQAKIEAAVEIEEVQIDESTPNRKDPYPLPNIDQLIDATSGHIMLSFMDAFSGYNQIKMNPKDISKTSFITHRAVYAYVMLPFGLTSAESTYQRAMNKIFKSQIGRNLECYVDDMIAKSTTIAGHVEVLKECFDNLRKNQLKLNLEKYTFRVGAGMFLGFMISNRGIEANPEKIKAIQEMRAPKTQKYVQKLAGSLAALKRFISKLEERCLPFLDLLKGANNKKEVKLSPECQKAFEEIKSYLSQPPATSPN